MMDDCFAPDGERKSRPILDACALERVLGLGDDALRVALCVQLSADFQRLRGALDADEAPQVARAAHELKGLAATIGADPLAELAASVDATVDALAADARAALVRPLKTQIDGVLAVLADARAGSAPQ